MMIPDLLPTGDADYFKNILNKIDDDSLRIEQKLNALLDYLDTSNVNIDSTENNIPLYFKLHRRSKELKKMQTLNKVYKIFRRLDSGKSGLNIDQYRIDRIKKIVLMTYLLNENRTYSFNAANGNSEEILKQTMFLISWANLKRYDDVLVKLGNDAINYKEMVEEQQ